jgi:CRISPR-associated protein Csd1
MILQTLRELALREGLVDDPAFESKPVRWVIELRGDGQFRQLYDTNTPQSQPKGKGKQPKLEAKLMAIPRRQVRSSGVKANFLVDNAKYVLATGSSERPPDPKNAARHIAYVELLQKALELADGPELRAVLAFLANERQLEACRVELERQGGFADNDLFTFEVDGTLLHEVEELRLYWASHAGETLSDGNQAQCLICGEQRVPATLHNQIQIRGASTSGIPLVSFNSDAFEKYGWSGSANAPVCTECMTAYVESLRRLTRSRYDNPRSGKRMSPLSTVLTRDTTAIYWAINDAPLLMGLSLLRDDPKRVGDLLASPHQGRAGNVGDPNRFYCLILSGTQGRAIVRRVHMGTVAEVESNLRRYFEAIDVDRFDSSTPLPQFRLLKALALNGDLDRLPNQLGMDLWLTALFGIPLSRSFLAAVVTRNRAERKVTPERAALLHLYFTTHSPSACATGTATPSAQSAKENPREMSLNRESKDQPYLLGRLLAVLEHLQTAAQGRGLNRTLVDRTFGAASTRPGVVFPQLIQTAQHHLAKAGRKAEGRALFLNRLLGEIMDGLELNGFAATLNLEQQGRFALGYYHQRQSFYASRPENGGTPPTQTKTGTTEEENAA